MISGKVKIMAIANIFKSAADPVILKVEMGEGIVAGSPDIITTVGCGSCIVLTLYDAKRRAGGLAHIMMPDSQWVNWMNHFAPFIPYHCADTAVPAMLNEMIKRGCSKKNIRAKIAGGARMFPSFSESETEIGKQNILSVKNALKKEQIFLAGFDVGGCHGRSVFFHLDSGRVVIKAFEKEDKEI